MEITDALYGEHGTLHALFAHLERSTGEWELADLLLAGRLLESTLLSHAGLEDELLFAALDAHFPGPGPVAAMRAEHEEIDRFLAALREAQDESTARRSLVHAIAVARAHFAKEEAVLFPLALDLLGAPALERLGETWADRRGVRLAAAA